MSENFRNLSSEISRLREEIRKVASQGHFVNYLFEQLVNAHDNLVIFHECIDFWTHPLSAQFETK